MKAKKKHRIQLLKYLASWDNDFPNKAEMAKVLGLKQRTLYFHFTPAELDDILSEGLDLRKKNSAVPRAEVYKAMLRAARKGVVPAQKEFLDRTEGKVAERHEHTGKGGRELFPALTDRDIDALNKIKIRPKE
ncbi:MAG: hypothetical protein BA867_08690 [Desulfobacterales bacterium S5133MH16]|nr:MAG: hypothetical protein BA867_08690 [Desulfobacterales bacterium S5133MH16]